MKQKTKVGILVALQQELSTLTNANVQSGSSYSLSDSVEICLTGMGSVNAKKGARMMIARGCNVLISWGTAAALDDDRHPGTLCIPDMIIFSTKKRLETSIQLRKTIRKQLLAHKMPVTTSALAHSSNILLSPNDKTQLRKLTNAKSADMESAAIHEVANKANVLFVAIRAISDSNNMTIPITVTKASSQGVLHMPRLILHLLINPADWLPVIRLALNFKKAEQTLRKTAQILLPFFENNFSKETFK